MKEFTWIDGEKSREIRLQRSCPCGCDFRDGVKGVGYITGSDSDGNGFTIWVETEEVYQAIENALQKRSVPINVN